MSCFAFELPPGTVAERDAAILAWDARDREVAEWSREMLVQMGDGGML